MFWLYTTVGIKYNPNDSREKLDKYNSLFDYVKLTISSNKLSGIGSYSLKPGYEAFIDFTAKEYADKFIEVTKKDLSDLVSQADIIFPLEHNSSPQSVDLKMWNTPAWQAVRENNKEKTDVPLAEEPIKLPWYKRIFRRK